MPSPHRIQRLLMMSAPLFALVIIGTVLADSQNLISFRDVPSDAAYGSSVQDLALKGIIRGYDDGSFGPGNALNRAQAAVIIHRYDRQIIQPLRDAIAKIRTELDLGSCGDATVQIGEQCDDGNVISEDGCSAECIQETLAFCPGGYAIGKKFAAADRCNECICTKSGIVCSKVECPTEEPDVHCSPIVCSDGSSHPTCTEDGYPINYVADPCMSVSPPQAPTTSASPICGNSICEEREYSIPPDRRFYCPQDCTGDEARTLSCATETEELLSLADSYKSCTTNSDCQLFAQSCPFLTCAEAVNRTGMPRMLLKKDAVLATCRSEGNLSPCTICPYYAAVCENEQCVLKTVADK